MLTWHGKKKQQKTPPKSPKQTNKKHIKQKQNIVIKHKKMKNHNCNTCDLVLIFLI